MVTLIAIVSVALGIGINTAIFSVIHSVMLEPLPYYQPEELVALHQVPERGPQRSEPDLSAESTPWWSYPKYRVVAQNNRSFREISAFAESAYVFTGRVESERLNVEFVSASYFPLLGISARNGRVFLSDEDKTPNTHPVALLSENIARRHFGSPGEAVGRSVKIDKTSFSVVGTLPPNFRGQSGVVDVWVPMMMAPALMFPRRLETPFASWHEVIGRLKPGKDARTVETEMAVLAERIEAAFPSGDGDRKIRAIPLREANLDPRIKSSLLITLVAVGLVLLIACVNVSNLLLSKTAGRAKEIATRAALGATRLRLFRQLLTETVILGVVAGVIALLLAAFTNDLLALVKPSSSPAFRAKDVEMLNFGGAAFDWPVLAFNFGLAFVCGFLFGVLPSLKGSAVRPGTGLQWTSRNVAGSPRLLSFSSRSVLVVGQVGLSVVLLTGAGLMIRSLLHLNATPLGFAPQEVLTARIQLPSGYEEGAFRHQLLTRLGDLPEVKAVALSSSTPASSNAAATIVKVIGSKQAGQDFPTAEIHCVSGGVFKTLGIPLLRGRSFTDFDREGSPKVVIPNQAAARLFWPGQDAIGKRVWLGCGWEDGEWGEVIGIVGDVKYGRVEEQAMPGFYLPYLQPVEPASFVLLKSNQDPTALAGSLRRIVRSIDRNLPVYDIQTMESRIAVATSRTRFVTVLLGIFAALALILSVVGLFGVVSYAVSSRLREIGIRIALGARATQVLTMVIGDGATLIACGLAVGVGAAMLGSSLLASQLYNVSTTDPLTIVTVVSVLMLVGLAACVIPALRASRVPPIDVLRIE